MSKISVRTRINIKAPPNDVFKYISETKYFYIWNPALRDITGAKKLGLGKAYDTTSVVLKDLEIKSHNIVVEFQPGKSLGLQNQMGTVKYASVFNLTDKGSHTLLTLKLDIVTESQIFGLTMPVLKRLANRELQTDMQALKIAVEDKIEL